MKFKISVPDLQYAMRTVRDVVPSSGPTAESVGVLISAKGGRAVFTAFNPEMLAKAVVKIDCEEDGEAVVDAVALYSAVSHFQSQKEDGVGTADVLIKSTPRARKLQLTTRTKYASGSETPHKRVFPLRNQEFFPDLPPENKVNLAFELPAEVLMDGIDSVAYAMASDPHQPIFTGMLFHLEPQKLTLFATNGICLAEYSSPVSFNGPTQRLVLPGAFATKIAKSFFEGDTLRFSLTDGMLFVRTANLVLGGTLIREEYPNYKSLLPVPKKFASVDKHILLDNLVNLSYEASQTEASRVKLRLQDGEASLFCGHSQNGGIPSTVEGSMEFDCNLKLLASSVRNVYGDNLRVGFVDADTLLQFSSAEDNITGASFTCLLVPLVT